MSDRPVEPAHDILDDALLSILVRQEEQWFPRDVASLDLRCGACERAFEVGFRFEHSPYEGQAGRPLYRTLDEALAACASLLTARESSIDEQDWARTRKCSCGAPPHLTRTERARLVRALSGTGAAIVLEARAAEGGPELACLRVPHRGLPEPVELTAAELARAFGRPLTLFDAWSALELGHTSRVDAERGVALWGAPDTATLSERLEPRAKIAPLVVVSLDASTVGSDAWPSSLAPLRAHVESGAAAAIAIEREAMLARLRALGAPVDAIVTHPRPERFEVRIGELVALAYPHRIARAMAAYGLTLADACARTIDQTVTGLRRIEAFLAQVTSSRAGSRVRIEGGVAAIVRPDGTIGPPFALESLPVQLDPRSSEMAREIRYLCDPVPEWADPTRVCTCGAPASVQRRLMPFQAIERMAGAADREPWVLERWTRDGETRAVDVVVVACDKHRRIHPRRWLEAAGLDDSSLARRLAQDKEHASFGVEVERVVDAAGASAIVARGPLVASVLLDPAWVAGLHVHAGRPIEGGAAEAWAFAPDGLCILDPRFREEERDRLGLLTCLASGLPAGAPRPFAIRARVDLGVAPSGRFGPLPATRDVI